MPWPGLDHVALIAPRGEVEQPRPQGRVEPRLDRERRIMLKQALESLGHHPGLGQRQDMARANQPAVAVRAAAADLPALDQRDLPAASHEEIRARRADDAAADHDRVPPARIRRHRRIPIANGSAGSTIRVDSALT